MRRWTLYLFVAVLTFFSGLGVDLGRRVLEEPRPYCTVAREAEKHHRKTVRIKGRLVIDSESLILFESCGPNQFLDTAVHFNGEIPSPFRELITHQSASRFMWQQADVIVEGQFDADYTNGCYGTPKFRIIADKLELLGPLIPFQLH